MKGLTEMTLSQMREAMVCGDVSSRELTESWLQALEAKEKDIGAFITLCPERALREADAIDVARARGEELSPLAGIPMAVKDNICVKGLPTTCASKMLENFVPPYNATAYEKLHQCPLLGKTNMDEFAMGSSTETSYFHTTHNPHNLDCVPGGSSGGSAAAVAAGEAILTLGSDTGGSIRQPASLCGVVGLKPTYGSVSRYGLVAFASSLDQIGPFGKSVKDVALLQSLIQGHDNMDATSAYRNYANLYENLNGSVQGLRIGVPKEYFGEGIDAEVKDAVFAAIKLLEQNGAFALIDAGEREAADGLVAYLQAAGVAKLDLLVMTHPHADHIGGMQAVLDAFPVDRAVLPDFAKAPMPTTSTFLNLLDAIREKQIPTVTARAGDVFPLGEGTLTVLGDGVAAENLNDISLVTLFEAPGLRCLSSGDGEKAVEDAVLASGADVHADVFKAAHHGSSTSNTQAFLDAVRPQAVVVSCGAGNSYGHPHSEALAAFANVGAQVYRTDTEGTIIAYVDKAGVLQMAVSRQEAA